MRHKIYMRNINKILFLFRCQKNIDERTFWYANVSAVVISGALDNYTLADIARFYFNTSHSTACFEPEARFVGILYNYDQLSVFCALR